MPLRDAEKFETCVSKHPTRNPAVDFAYLVGRLQAWQPQAQVGYF
jgi:hypothetical protein